MCFFVPILFGLFLLHKNILVMYKEGENVTQLSLYMDDASMKSLREDVEAAGKSVSSCVREVLERRNEKGHGWLNGWPPGCFESLQPLGFE